MSLTDAAITADIDSIFTDLSACGAAETVTFYEADGTTVRVADVDIIRNSYANDQQVVPAGLDDDVAFVLYAKYADVSTVVIGDIAVLSDGRFRVLKDGRGPSLNYRRFDMGAEFQDGNP